MAARNNEQEVQEGHKAEAQGPNVSAVWAAALPLAQHARTRARTWLRVKKSTRLLGGLRAASSTW